MQQGRVANIPTVASLLAAFFAIALTLGVVGAGVLMPAAATVGSATTGTIGLYDSLPSEFTSVVPNQQTTIYANDGKTVIATLYEQNRIVVPLKQIAPVMRKAQVAIEDKRFYSHGGVDIQGMGAVAAGVLAGKDARGASTLTQQYVKVTLETAARMRGDTKAAKAAKAVTAARKIQEMRYATEVEKVKSKDEILQGYLNLVYFGDQAYGVEAAARHFFSTTAAKLTLPQAATLAGQVQNPGTVNAIINPKATLKRRNTVLFAMRQQGVITQKEYQDAKAAPLGVKIHNAPSSCAASQYPFICQYVVGWLEQQPALGDSVNDRKGHIYNDGLQITTSFDLRLQREAQEIMARHVPADNYKPVGASSVTIDPNTGKMKSMVVSTGFTLKPDVQGKQGVNWAVDGVYGANGGVDIGSTEKLFTLVEALKQGWHGGSIIHGIRPAPSVWYRSDFPGECTVGPGGWNVANAEGDINPTSVDLRTATAQSVNTAFARLASIVGACNVRRTATEMGLHQARDGKPITTAVPGIVLGSTGVSPANLAQSYGVVAAGGKLCPQTPIEKITSSSGKPIDLKLGGCKQVIPEGVANEAADILKSVMTRGTGRKLGGLAGGRTSAGKTGTSHYNQSWFVGITPQLSTAVWVGNPTGFEKFHHVWINGRFYRQVFGADIAGPIWRETMNVASEGMKKVDFGQNRGGAAPSANQVTVPDVSGLTPDDAIAKLKDAGLTGSVTRYVTNTDTTPGLVAYTRPAAGTQVSKGDAVRLRVAASGRSRSNGTSSSGSSTAGTGR